MDKLRECPFCGGEAFMVKTKRCGRYVACWDCNIATDEYDTDDIGSAYDKAIAVWNRRAEPENKPLTQEEVSAMCGEPLYVIPLDADADWDKHWAIMHWDSVTANSILSKGKMYFLYEADYGKTWLAYRNRPK